MMDACCKIEKWASIVIQSDTPTTAKRGMASNHCRLSANISPVRSKNQLGMSSFKSGHCPHPSFQRSHPTAV